MALTKMSTGWISGPIYEFFHHNYPSFFFFVLLASIPPIILAWFAPFPQSAETASGPVAAGGH
jgi:PAT family beta-lactamase induction signal transducer AmpG